MKPPEEQDRQRPVPAKRFDRRRLLASMGTAVAGLSVASRSKLRRRPIPACPWRPLRRCRRHGVRSRALQPERSWITSWRRSAISSRRSFRRPRRRALVLAACTSISMTPAAPNLRRGRRCSAGLPPSTPAAAGSTVRPSPSSMPTVRRRADRVDGGESRRAAVLHLPSRRGHRRSASRKWANRGARWSGHEFHDSFPARVSIPTPHTTAPVVAADLNHLNTRTHRRGRASVRRHRGGHRLRRLVLGVSSRQGRPQGPRSEYGPEFDEADLGSFEQYLRRLSAARLRGTAADPRASRSWQLEAVQVPSSTKTMCRSAPRAKGGTGGGIAEWGDAACSGPASRRA